MAFLFSFWGEKGGQKAGGGGGVTVFAWVECWLSARDSDAGRPGSRMRMEESGSPSPVPLSPPFP